MNQKKRQRQNQGREGGNGQLEKYRWNSCKEKERRGEGIITGISELNYAAGTNDKKNEVQIKKLEIILGFEGKFPGVQNESKHTTFRLVLRTSGYLINPAQG